MDAPVTEPRDAKRKTPSAKADGVLDIKPGSVLFDSSHPCDSPFGRTSCVQFCSWQNCRMAHAQVVHRQKRKARWLKPSGFVYKAWQCPTFAWG